MQDQSNQEGRIAEFTLGNAEAIVAGTLALMTALVQGICEEHRRAIRHKVISNLAELEQHSQLSEPFRAMASHLQQHWYAMDGGPASVRQDFQLWHQPAGKVQ